MKSETFYLKIYINMLDFLRKTAITQRNIRKKYLQLFATKLTAKIPYHSNDKEHYQSFIRSKNAKSAKQ